ncbi:MAG TPA: preprotein translocase subunit SecG [Hydrogenophaga sp.]|uniref:preprotein translocase subunit SecG n=1 Tax=Hydrogenophaga sp. TaxID=1904254 RepID=UPI002D0EE70B|nr:preprotein translocase subunit SecG [Hydrogenophaga sp.]HMN94496.1 preprotein translocase subunit SecG [Hydrogenophaga sp.]HMP09950.1 preprotein translocase subunit SecG [Hydrogenophaga sp.]
MNFLLTLLLAVQMLSALAMIGLILMQHGKGADAGAAFGGGGAGSASLFGASGGANFLSRTTGVLATVFLASTLGLAYFGNLREAPSSGSVLEGAAPATPATSIPAGEPAAVPAPAEGSTQAPAGAAQIPGQ